VQRWATSTLQCGKPSPTSSSLNHRCYGYRRLQASLTRQCVTLSEKVVQRLMKQESLVVPKPKRRRYASYLGEISPAPENLINRDFQAAVPNEKWLTDITEFQIPAGKVYLSPIIDCFDGMVVSWTIGTNPDASWSTRCWMQPSRRWPKRLTGPWFTPIGAATTAGQVGYRE
jgi:transposase InsO family protein